MRRNRRAAGPGLLLILLALPAAAVGADTDATVPVASDNWTLQTRIEQAADTNPRFQAAAESTLLERVSATLVRIVRADHGELSLRAEGGGQLYPDHTDLNRFSYAGLANGRLRVSPRAELRAAGSFSSSYGYQAPILLESGLLLPLTVTDAGRVSAGVTYQVSPRSSLASEAVYDHVSFSASELASGSVLALNSSWSRVLDADDTVGLVHVYQHSASRGRLGDTHTLMARWSRVLRPGLTLDGAFGASRIAADGGAAPVVRPQGAAGISARFEHSALQAAYARSVSQAFGLGRDRVADLVSGRYDVAAGRRIRLSATATYDSSRDPFDPTFRYVTASAGSGLAFSLSRRTSLEAAYAYSHRNSAGPSPALTRQTFGLSLSYGNAWE